MAWLAEIRVRVAVIAPFTIQTMVVGRVRVRVRIRVVNATLPHD